MISNELKKSLEMRQENLIFLLKNKKEQLELEKQHQIYGAIKEIDYIMRMMKVTEEDSEDDIKIVETPVTPELPVRGAVLEQKQRTFKSPIRIKFSKNE